MPFSTPKENLGSGSSQLLKLLPKIDRLDVQSVHAGFAGQLKFSWDGHHFPINLTVGYFGLDLMVSGARLTAASLVDLRLIDGHSKNLTIPIALQILPEDPFIASRLSEVVNPKLTGLPDSDYTAEIGHFIIGSTLETSFDLFKYVEISIFTTKENKFKINEKEEAMSYNVKSIDVQTIDTGLSVTTKVNFINLPYPKKFPLTFFVNYASVDLLLNGLMVGRLSMHDLFYDGQPNQSLTLNVSLTMVSRDEILHDLINDALHELFDTSTTLTHPSIIAILSVTNGFVGSSVIDLFQFMKLIRYDLKIDKTLAFAIKEMIVGKSIMPSEPPLLTQSRSIIEDWLPYWMAKLEIVPKGIDGQVQFKIRNIIPLSVKIGYMSVYLSHQSPQNKISLLETHELQIDSTAGSSLELSSFFFVNQLFFEYLVDSILGNLPVSILITGFTLGNTQSTAITLLSKTIYNYTQPSQKTESNLTLLSAKRLDESMNPSILVQNNMNLEIGDLDILAEFRFMDRIAFRPNIRDVGLSPYSNRTLRFWTNTQKGTLPFKSHTV